MRAVVSFGPPAAKPTTQWIGRLGYLSAARPIPNVIADTPIKATSRPSRRAARIALSFAFRRSGGSTGVSVIAFGSDAARPIWPGTRDHGAGASNAVAAAILGSCAPWPAPTRSARERHAAGSAPPPSPPMTRERLVPLIVAVALFMENMDFDRHRDVAAGDRGRHRHEPARAQARAHLLPARARHLHPGQRLDRRPLRRAHHLPRRDRRLHARLDRLRASRSRCEHFVVARFVQGMGGAMMAPVGRLVLVRSVAKRELVDAMAWLTMPALIGPVLGPPLGGFITTYFAWRWIFLINVPIGILGICRSSRASSRTSAPRSSEPFDAVGFVLAGLGLGGLAFGLDGARPRLPAAPPRRRADRRRRGLLGALCAARAAHAGAGHRSRRCSACRPSAPAWSAASCSASASARCRSCCR